MFLRAIRNFFQSILPPVRPNSTQAVALVHSNSTLKMIKSEIVGIAAVPRLVCTIGTPSCTLLPKIPPMPVITRPVES